MRTHRSRSGGGSDGSASGCARGGCTVAKGLAKSNHHSRRPLMARTEEERETDQEQPRQKPPPQAACGVQQIIDVFTLERVSECAVEQTVAVLIVVASRTQWTSSKKARCCTTTRRVRVASSAGHGGAECGHSCSLDFWRTPCLSTPWCHGSGRDSPKTTRSHLSFRSAFVSALRSRILFHSCLMSASWSDLLK